MAQLNPLVGDVCGNQRQIIQAIEQSKREHGAQCVIFSELVLTGYPPEDLLLRPAFIQRCRAAVDAIAAACVDTTAIVGAPYADGGKLFNAAYVLRQGAVDAVVCKHHLPNYSVFDEKRYFVAGDPASVVELCDGLAAGITICEDIWHEQPAQRLLAAGAKLIINVNASPYHRGKHAQRLTMLRARCRQTRLPIIYVNQVGGQDELVFDGASLALDAGGAIVAQAPAFDACLWPLTISVAADHTISRCAGERADAQQDDANLYQALVCGVRDYVDKNSFSGVVLGLSGGIDSALTLAIAVDALGAQRVSAVMMPSRYTAAVSLAGAQEEARLLGVDYHVIDIEPAFKAFKTMLSTVFAGAGEDVTEENLQARCRGVLLMAIANKWRRIVLATGNKSEMAVGYATLYGDMAGGFAPLKDVYKTWVYRLARYRNTLGDAIPASVIERAPTAELAPGQTDQDTLPPYDTLDEILQAYIEDNLSVDAIARQIADAATVTDVTRRVDANEYKRRQAPPGIKVTTLAFGRDRRYPITFDIGAA